MLNERKIYKNNIQYLLNFFLFPFKMIIPQPIINKIPYLKTNKEIRLSLALQNTTGLLLDIGCGENDLVKKYKLQGGDGLGVDVYDWGSVDMVVKDTASLPFENEKFDTITFIACLNHIPNRVEVLKEAKRILKKDGKIIITNLTPFISLIWHKWAYWDDDQHERGMEEGEVWGFKSKEIEKIFLDTGYYIFYKKKFSFFLNNYYIIKKK